MYVLGLGWWLGQCARPILRRDVLFYDSEWSREDGYVLFCNLGDALSEPLSVLRVWDMSFHGGCVAMLYARRRSLFRGRGFHRPLVPLRDRGVLGWATSSTETSGAGPATCPGQWCFRAPASSRATLRSLRSGHGDLGPLPAPTRCFDPPERRVPDSATSPFPWGSVPADGAGRGVAPVAARPSDEGSAAGPDEGLSRSLGETRVDDGGTAAPHPQSLRRHLETSFGDFPP